MKNLKILLLLALVLSACASRPSLPKHLSITPLEVTGTVVDWSNETISGTSTISMWYEDIQGSKFALMQLRAGLDLYRFALSREQVLLVIDAINNYQSVISQTSSERSPAIGWLAKTKIKLKRLGDVANDDLLIINVERDEGAAPVLSLTFESWLLAFLGGDSPAERMHMKIIYSSQSAQQLRSALEKLYGEL